MGVRKNQGFKEFKEVLNFLNPKIKALKRPELKHCLSENFIHNL